MSLAIAKTTAVMAVELVAQSAANQRQALESEALLAKTAAESQSGAALQLVMATTESLGQLINIVV